ncbi:MAG: prepilin-type N-terminal cleavage/methylation domain-containing protein [bacterium]|nr:prepilin-type N-terminal cleavage/methylation domain-containing protein [bacterium]
MTLKNLEKNCKGITLLEILVAISISSIVLIGAIGLFISLIKNQQTLLNKAYVLNTLSYSTEYMSKAIRMAQKDKGGTCLDNSMENFNSTGDSIKFLNYNNECQRFFLDSGVLKVSKKISGVDIAQALTPANITIESLNFVLAGQSQDDNLQPKISFSLKARVQSSSIPSFLIQTTISQRMLDIAY